MYSVKQNEISDFFFLGGGEVTGQCIGRLEMRPKKRQLSDRIILLLLNSKMLVKASFIF